jgi:hypothetical protein
MSQTGEWRVGKTTPLASQMGRRNSFWLMGVPSEMKYALPARAGGVGDPLAMSLIAPTYAEICGG